MAQTDRVAEHPMDPMFLERWSPRAMSGEPIADRELMSLFEAARWAPSSGNVQPWRFLYARRGTEHFDSFYGLLAPANQVWCARAAVLMVIVSAKNRDNGKPNRTHTFCTGSAWMSLALQASQMGLVAHGMAGFDYDRAARELGVPDDFQVEAMCAIGKPGRVEDLPKELQDREKPSGRKRVEEFVMEGGWKR